MNSKISWLVKLGVLGQTRNTQDEWVIQSRFSRFLMYLLVGVLFSLFTESCWAKSSLSSQADILNNLAKSLGPVQNLIAAATYLIGILFIMKAIYSLKVYGEGRSMMSGSTSIKEPLVYFMVGGALLFFPNTMQMMMKTTFDYTNIMDYSNVPSPNATISELFGYGSAIGSPLTRLIQVIGLIAFVRGWILIARGASQGQPPGNTGKGLMHVFGGILAVNIVGTLNVINNTLYG